MKLVKGIIISSTDYGENDKILNVATVNEGIITVTARGVKKPNAKLKGCVSVLTFGDFSLIEGKGRYILQGVDVEEQFYACWQDSDKYASAMICVELFQKSTRLDIESYDETLLLLKALQQINFGSIHPMAVALQFMVKMSVLLGVDYSEIGSHNTDVLTLCRIMEESGFDELDGLEYGVNQAVDGIKYFDILFNNNLGLKLKVLRQALQVI